MVRLKHTSETRTKISIALKGKPKSSDHRAKMSAANLGRVGSRHPYHTGLLLSVHKGYTYTYILGGWAAAHRVAYVYYTGVHSIPRGWDVHHVNGDRLDNARENLELITKGEHNRRHKSNQHLPQG